MAKSIDPIRKLQIDQAVLEARRMREAGKIDEASNRVAAIVRSEPTHVGALRLMGSLATQTGNPDIAIGCYSRALAAGPRSSDILLDLANALLSGGRPAEAISAFKQALALRPRDGAAFRGLGQAQLDMGNRADALRSFRKTLSVLPYDKYAAHMIAALSGEALPEAARYVPDLFDNYAGIFDEHLTGALDYSVPGAIEGMLALHAADRPIASLLDLGCGTGLVGVALQHRVPSMDGIDLAGEMTRRAAARGIYRFLHTGDISAASTEPALAGPYDLVTAADVFIYVGPLEATFGLVRDRLAPNGLFVFSVETVEGDDVVIRSSGRFAHPANYIEALAAAHGFALLARQAMPIRKELHRPIPGMLYLLERC